MENYSGKMLKEQIRSVGEVRNFHYGYCRLLLQILKETEGHGPYNNIRIGIYKLLSRNTGIPLFDEKGKMRDSYKFHQDVERFLSYFL